MQQSSESGYSTEFRNRCLCTCMISLRSARIQRESVKMTFLLWWLILVVNLTHLGRGSLAWRTASIKLVCGYVCGGLFFIANWCRPTWVVPFLGRWPGVYQEGSLMWAWEEAAFLWFLLQAPDLASLMADRELKVEDEISALTQVVYHSNRKEIGTLSNSCNNWSCTRKNCVCACAHMHQGALMCGG